VASVERTFLSAAVEVDFEVDPVAIDPEEGF
jgi:hypothetical protein